MAIKDDTNIARPTAVLDRGQQPAQSQPQAGYQQPAQPAADYSSTGTAGPVLGVAPGGKFSFHRGAMFGAPIASSTGSEYCRKLKDALVKAYKDADESMQISIIDMDRSIETALSFSAVVICVRLTAAPAAGVAYHTLILEATGPKLENILQTYNNQQVEVTRVTSDAFNDRLTAMVREKVSTAFRNTPLLMVEGTVVPANFKPEDELAVQRLALNAGLACANDLLIRLPDFRDLNLAELVTDGKLVINLAYQRQQQADIVGNPMRADILVNFSSKKNIGGQDARYAAPNSGDVETRVSEVTGYVDLVWSPVSPQVANPWGANQLTATKKYIARGVITNLASNYAYTPASVLLALATFSTVREDNSWIQVFRPQATPEGEVDLADIGALNIDGNLMNDTSGFGVRINTKDSTFRLEDLGQLVAAMIQPGLMMSLDCPEVGPQSWYLSVFSMASTGHEGACNAIRVAANQLTNGKFSALFNPAEDMFVDTNNRVHMGHWKDTRGNLRDIRDIDHVAVCNLVGDRNPMAIRQWSDTWLRTNVPLPMRLAERKRMISALTNETAVFTGFAQRVTFSAAFINALVTGIRQTNLPVQVISPLSGADFSNQRGIAGFGQSALLVPGTSMAQAQQYGQAGGYQMGYFGDQNRW